MTIQSLSVFVLKKIFAGVLTGIVSILGVGCGLPDVMVQPTDEIEVIPDEIQSDRVRYFEKDFYIADTGEKLPINAIRAELLDTVSPESFRQVAERADAIVVGEPLESLEESEIRRQDGVTKYEFSVSDFKVKTALKGDFQSGDVISLGQDVAILADEQYRLPTNHPDWNERSLVLSTPNNYRPVKKGSQYILFLYKRTDAGADAYFPIFYALGRFNIDGTDELNYNPYGFQPVNLEIRDWAIALSQAAISEPNQNPLPRIIEQSELK